MDMLLHGVLFVVGLILVVFFAEKLVEGVVGTSLGFGVSAFLISVVFVGFDPENLGVGAVGSFEGASGIALGTIVGAAMVAVALAFGVTALFAPMSFERAPRRILAVPPLAVVLLGALAWDGLLSRLDGALLLVGFGAAVAFLAWMSGRGVDIEAGGEVAEVLEEEEPPGRGKSLALFAVSLVAILAGSEMLVTSGRAVIERVDLSETVFGMTVLALLVSIEELARELPAAVRGRADITFGNVVGSCLAFFLFNAGIIALVRPVPVGGQVRGFYLPLAFLTVLAVSGFMLRRRVPRWAGGVLVVLYVLFAVGGFFR